MDKLDEDNYTSKAQRYSIPALLWIGHLCQTNKTPFDLSRLSFAIFHAGFVKPSGACAPKLIMPLQDISVNRNRGRSLDASGTAEDHVPFSATGRRLLEPQRQPVNAPGSPGGKAQADEGFVRFLKTHSSPTHQRVTAGGRIVPMEPPSAPPQFRLLVSNPIARSIVPATQNNGGGSAPQEPLLKHSSTINDSEQKGCTSKSLDPGTNVQRNGSRHLLTEPFPKFYDGQPVHGEVQKPVTNGNKASFSTEVCIEQNTGRPESGVLANGQNTVHSVVHGLETTTAVPNHNLSHRSASADRPYVHSQHPVKMKSSRQQAPIASQYIPNKISPLLGRTSTAMTPELYDDGQGHNQHPATTELGPCYGLDLATNRAILYSSLFHIVPQGYRVPQFAGLPMYANQLGYFPAAYYAPDPYKQSSSFLPALPQPSFGETQAPLASPASLNVSDSLTPSQLVLQQKLADAEASFNHSTQQERMLDQYLAMNMDKMDIQSRRAFIAKRMQIVEERAAAKDCMNQLQHALNADIARIVNIQSDCQSLTSLRPVSQSRPANRLNVQAPSWVPKAGTSSKAVKIQNPNTSTTMATASSTTSEKTPPSPVNMSETKSTPVKPTATVSEDPFTTKLTTVIFSPKKSPVDEWGARLGAAPPELERQQSKEGELLESMVTGTSQPCAGPQPSAGNVSGPDGGWNGKDGRAPSQVQTNHRQYPGAIRKDLGPVGVIMLSNGQTVKADGQNYGQPGLKYIGNEFEKDCWLGKTNPDQRMGAAHPHQFECSFENVKCAPPPQKSRQTQEWINGVVEIQKPVSSARAPWISQGMNLLSAKGEPSICLQDTYATSRTRGINGAAGHLRGRH